MFTASKTLPVCLLSLRAGIDSSLPDNFGETVIHGVALIVTFATMTYVGGWPLLVVTLLAAALCYHSENSFIGDEMYVNSVYVCSWKVTYLHRHWLAIM